MRRFGRPVGNADSLSFMYYNDARSRRSDNDVDAVDNASVANRTCNNNISLNRMHYAR